MKTKTLMLVFAVTILARSSVESAQVSGDRAVIDAFYRAWMGAAQQGMTVYASYYEPTGQILPPNSSPVVGRDAIAEWMERAQAASPYTTRPEGVQVDEVRFLTSDWAVYRSTLRGRRVPKVGGDPVAFQTKYFDLLHRNAEGQWQVSYRMWSDNGTP